MHWQKKGLVYKPQNEAPWWMSHGMAPAAIMYNAQTIRIYQGCLDANGISRIGFIDVAADNPCDVVLKSTTPVLDLGEPGCFDDNGVFPGHVYQYAGKVYLYYTGFQKLDKIPFTNFGGLAISEDGGNTFVRVSKAPVMDRADEGLFTRAGTSVIVEDGVYKSCYSAGSEWAFVAGKKRPVYEVYFLESLNGIDFPKRGKCIVPCNHAVEHGLGRPQIVKIKNDYYVFYTRRLLNFRYHMGVATSKDLKTWVRIDEWLSTIRFGEEGDFDNQMVYFPCVLNTGEKTYLFYSGNNFGRDGLGYAELCP